MEASKCKEKVGASSKLITERPSSRKVPIKILPDGIKTQLNVEMISPNQLRFVDEPKPPDLLTNNNMELGQSQQVLRSPDNVNMEEETTEDSDMVEETPT
ncbi:Copia protein [Sesbania bispinosa]|nr:Copia protein [Sesbania bispinosa]